MFNTIICGNSLDVQRALPENTFDLIVTDPPYGVDYQSQWTSPQKRKKKILNDKLPFIWWLHDAYRILKPGGALLCFVRWDVDAIFSMAVETAGFTIKSQVIWDRRSTGMGDLKGQFAPQHDNIIFATKGRFIFPGYRPSSIQRYGRGVSDEDTHPNQKPQDLLEHLIEHTTPEGGSVWDPFAGSGSALKAAKSLGRRFLGCDRDFYWAHRISQDMEIPLLQYETQSLYPHEETQHVVIH